MTTLKELTGFMTRATKSTLPKTATFVRYDFTETFEKVSIWLTERKRGKKYYFVTIK